MNVASNLPQFNSALASYIAAHQGRKGVQEIMQKKGNNLGMRLFKVFSDHKWGGPGKPKKNLARAELDARVSTGKGIKVRSLILKTYQRERASMNYFSRSVGQRLRFFKGTLDDWSSLRDKREKNKEQRSNLWRKAVQSELSARQRGIGMLAASFLWYRKRSSQARGTYYVKNRSGKYNLGYAVADESSFQIVADAPGSAQVDARYGLVNQAISEEMADIEKYFMDRPQYWRFWQTFNALEAAK